MKQIIVILLYTMCTSVCTQAQTFPTYTVSGYTKDICGNAADVYFVEIRTNRWKGGWSRIDKTGHFEIKNVEAGKYQVITWSNRYNVQSIDSVTVSDHSLHNVEITVACIGYVKSIPQEPAYLLSCELKRVPDRNNVACAMGGGTVQRGDEVSLYGSRNNGYVLYIDGIKMRHIQWVPQASIQEVDVWTMSIPANLDCSP